MTSYTVATAKHASLATSAADSVTFTANPGQVEVLVRGGTGPIYFRTDGVAPVVGGDDTYIATFGVPVYAPLDLSDTVQMVAAAAADYSVTGF